MIVKIPTSRAEKTRFCTIPGRGVRSFSGRSIGQPYRDSIFSARSRRNQYCSFVIFLIVIQGRVKARASRAASILRSGLLP
ncbi:hypothetical protein [Akkermansia phage Chantilly]|nr:hypothetical protein [Akkermansia phage Chantilly]